MVLPTNIQVHRRQQLHSKSKVGTEEEMCPFVSDVLVSFNGIIPRKVISFHDPPHENLLGSFWFDL